ncbi:hypothetical protein [Endozoicomonas sp. ISHI1]|uniref:hypothetical protein n=1 Tax=Endozoicomonas sp. ISHI1 TaxID=2825882 RepID=UPI002147291C|nr:hypothetical protein [Endozoicomonas sp. ISHI1]
MNNVDNNSSTAGFFSPKPEEETPEGVSFGRTTTAADNVDASLSSDPDHSSQNLGAVASSSTSLEQRVVSNQASTEIDAANKKAQENVTTIINYLKQLKQQTLIYKNMYGREAAPDQDIQVFEKVTQLLKYLEPLNISTDENLNDGRHFSEVNKGSFTSDYHVSYRGEEIFSLTSAFNVIEDGLNWSLAVKTTSLFDELYFAPDAPGYQAVKSEFEALQTKSSPNDLKGSSARE